MLQELGNTAGLVPVFHLELRYPQDVEHYFVPRNAATWETVVLCHPTKAVALHLVFNESEYHDGEVSSCFTASVQVCLTPQSDKHWERDSSANTKGMKVFRPGPEFRFCGYSSSSFKYRQWTVEFYSLEYLTKLWSSLEQLIEDAGTEFEDFSSVVCNPYYVMPGSDPLYRAKLLEHSDALHLNTKVKGWLSKPILTG